MKNRSHTAILIVILTLVSVSNSQTLVKNDIVGPPGSVAFGSEIAILPNGNIVVTDPDFSVVGGAQLIGAVYLYNTQGNLISTVTGTTANDRVGSGGITVLENGDYVVLSPDVSRSGIPSVGAVTLGDQDVGISGTVSGANSLVGSNTDDFQSSTGSVTAKISPLPNGNFVLTAPDWANGSLSNAGMFALVQVDSPTTGIISSANAMVGSQAGDRVGNFGVTILSNGNFVVSSRDWNDSRGAVTFGLSDVPMTGSVSDSNSLVGSTKNDNVQNVTPLANGNYVVHGRDWDNGAIENAGFALFANGTTGVTGEVTVANAVVGATQDDRVGTTITALTNGRFVIQSPEWDNGAIVDAGAASMCVNPTNCFGTINSNNSLVGSSANDKVGSGGVEALTNGNYVVSSPDWDDDTTSDVGAATFGNGSTGITGPISSANSLIGSQADDSVGKGGSLALANGNYIVLSPEWNNGMSTDAGAVTFGNGNLGITGFVSVTNSLVGTKPGDSVGNLIEFSLTNGNYVVISPFWDNGKTLDVGAATFGNGTTGIAGPVSSANSLFSSVPSDQIGNGSANNRALPVNGNYVINDASWNASRGFVTVGNGVSGTTGEISSTNSIVGTTPGDAINTRLVLENGNLIVGSGFWQDGSLLDVGAYRFVDGQMGSSGELNQSNALTGTSAGDGFGSVVLALSDSYYAILFPKYDSASTVDAGAITFSNGPISGQINQSNSIIGEVQGDLSLIGMNKLGFDPNLNRLYYGRPLVNKVKYAQYQDQPTGNTRFDFDGDQKADISVFRRNLGEWWYLRSVDGQDGAFAFGSTTDVPVPADFTGDGIADFSFWRPSSGEWFVLRSDNTGFFSFPFGADGDIPAPGDFDGDGTDDAAVFRPSSGTWFILNSSDGQTQFVPFGAPQDLPLVGDYDGDGTDDVAIYKPDLAEYWQLRSTEGQRAFAFGQPTDVALTADFTGDGTDDMIAWRPSTGFWFVLRSEDSDFFGFPFGANGDIPAAADYDGDGTADATVFRPSDTTWYSQQSTNGAVFTAFGVAG